MNRLIHQYIDRETSRVCTEQLFADKAVSFLYSNVRESSSLLFNALTSPRFSGLLGWFHFDLRQRAEKAAPGAFIRDAGIDLSECLDHPGSFTTLRRVFERKIRYWDKRPMPSEEDVVVAPADSKVLLGSLAQSSLLYLKEKFFHLEELISTGGSVPWHRLFVDGDFAVFRLTPDKYHYNHAPVSGRVADLYAVEGRHHSCNPAVPLAIASPYSKNQRFITIIDTDVSGGTGVGMVAMVEVVALMIGEIIQAYSEEKYDNPHPLTKGMFVKKGQPKSLYRPGSSTDVLIFQPGRAIFSEDLTANNRRLDVESRYSTLFGRSVVETDLKVRSAIARKVK
ncbi:MAG: phosphatidylserine decarboxylase [Deltaproteobacteria bacterium]|nr:phosphatidylserine decarboxylase [Deltaproteobacteria bacterium]